MRRVIHGIALSCAMYAAASLGADKEYGQLRVATDLLDAPFSDAKIASRLGANTRVEIVKRQGAWMRVVSGRSAGWVRLHQVRLGDGGAPTKTSSDAQVLKSVRTTGSSGGSGIVATTGIRGLSAEQLQNAKPNSGAVQTLERYAADDARARAFAAETGLKEQSIAPLPKP